MSFFNTNIFSDTNLGFRFKFHSVIWQTDWSRQYPDHRAAKTLFSCVKEATFQAKSAHHRKHIEQDSPSSSLNKIMFLFYVGGNILS